MNIPPYWAKARHEGRDPQGAACEFIASGWSFASLEEARANAVMRAKWVFELITSGKQPGRYDYSDRPIREEIVHPLGEDDTPVAMVTRNRYGALILNTVNVLFADVDLPAPAPCGFVESILLLFNAEKRARRATAHVDKVRDGILAWAERNPGRSFRLYRTCEGFRLLFTDQLYEPKSEHTRALLEELGSDPMYVMLTTKQNCFRARLTAKPWRCACPRPPNAFPWENEADEQAFRRWESAYTKTDAGYKVCDLVQEFGQPARIDAIHTVITAHDNGTRVDSNAPLA